jgi:anaerobic magnesium-protoporphyrin IX monomethyl ester cyclase
MPDLDQFIKSNMNLDLCKVKLAFIQPNYPYNELEIGHNLENYNSVLPNFGALQLLKYILSKGLLKEVKYFESSFYDNDYNLKNEIIQYFNGETGILAATCYTGSLHKVRELFNRFDNIHYLKIVGGPHITAMPDISFAHIAVRGDGETTLEEIITKFPDFTDIKTGIAYESNSIRNIRRPRWNSNYNNIPLPAYELIKEYREQDIYFSTIGKAMSDTAIYMTSLGCYGNCSFCPTKLLHGKYKAKSTDLVLQEINLLKRKYNFTNIQLQDDNIFDRPDTGVIFKYLSENNIGWTCNARIDSINIKTIRELCNFGCKYIFLGIESFCEKNLEYFNKGINLNQISNSLTLLNDCSTLISEVGIIIGSPIDNHETILKSFRISLTLPIDFIGITILNLIPGTLEWRRACTRNILIKYLDKNGNYRPEYYTVDKLSPLRQPTVCKSLKKHQLNCLLLIGYSMFYIRQTQIERLTGKINNAAVINLVNDIKNGLDHWTKYYGDHDEVYKLLISENTRIQSII